MSQAVGRKVDHPVDPDIVVGRPPQHGGRTASTVDDPLLQAVPRARLELRHKILGLSFLCLSIVPTGLSSWYLWTRASDQYVSTVGFSVRNEDTASSVELLGGLTSLAGGGSATSDSDILYDFLRSEDIVGRLDQKIDLRDKFSTVWPRDFVFGLDPSVPVEELTKYWKDRVRVLYDTSSRIITVEVSAFTPGDAYEIARETFRESSSTINRLSDIAREDATRYTRTELESAKQRLTSARQALTSFRMQTQIIDPVADLEGRMGVLNALQAQLADALVALDTLRENSNSDADARVQQAERRISSIRNRISEERAVFGSENNDSGDNYSRLVAEYERLASDMQFAETTYRSAQAAYDLAVAEAQRQTRYLAAHIEPKVPESSIMPRRFFLLSCIFGLTALIWAVSMLIYYSVKDRR